MFFKFHTCSKTHAVATPVFTFASMCNDSPLVCLLISWGWLMRLLHPPPFSAMVPELDNCSMKKQSGSTNSKGLPVLFQGFGLVWFGLVNLLPVQSRGLLWLVPLLCPPHPPQLNIHRMSEPGNCSIKTQSGSTNSKGLPVLFQWLPPRNCHQ